MLPGARFRRNYTIINELLIDCTTCAATVAAVPAVVPVAGTGSAGGTTSVAAGVATSAIVVAGPRLSHCAPGTLIRKAL